MLAGRSLERLAELRDFAEVFRSKDRGPAPVLVSDLFGALSSEGAAARERPFNDGRERVDADAWWGGPGHLRRGGYPVWHASRLSWPDHRV